MYTVRGMFTDQSDNNWRRRGLQKVTAFWKGNSVAVLRAGVPRETAVVVSQLKDVKG